MTAENYRLRKIDEFEATMRFVRILKAKTGGTMAGAVKSEFERDFDCKAYQNKKRVEIEVTQIAQNGSLGDSDNLWKAIKRKLDNFYTPLQNQKLILLTFEQNLTRNPRHGQVLIANIVDMLDVARKNISTHSHQPFEEIWYLGLGERGALHQDYTVKVWPER